MANDPVDTSVAVNDVKPSFGERFFSGLGGAIKGGAGLEGKSALDDAIEKHHQRRLDEARMHRQNAATYAGVLATGFDPKTGQKLTSEQEQQYQNWYESSWAAYEKAAGVSKDTKGHLQRAKAIVEHIIGMGRKSRQGQGQGGGAGQVDPSQSTSTEGVVRGGGGSGGGMTPPPAPQSSAQAHLPEMQAPTVRQQMADLNDPRSISGSQRAFAGGVEQRKQVADQLGLEKGSRAYQEFVATGKFPATAHLQHVNYVTPQDPTPKLGSYDPATGEIIGQDGKVVADAKPAPSAASQAPKQIHYLSPDGKPLFGFQVGMKLYDQEGKELPPGTEFFTRGMLPTETLRQVITYDAQGNPQINTLETMRTPITGGKSTGGASGATGATQKPKQGGMTPPPAAKSKGEGIEAPPQATDARGKPLGMSAGMQKAQVQRATAVREANTQVFGDPSNPDFHPLKDFAHLADDKDSRERLGKALQLTFDNLENEEKQHGSFVGLIQAYTGVPQALAAAKAGVRRDVIESLTPEEQDALDATISSFSSVVGLRSLTSASAAQFSVKALERDLPMIGVTAVNSKQFNDKLAHIGEIAFNGTKTISDATMPAKEKEFYRKQLEGLRGGKKSSGAPSKAGMSAPPKGKETPDEEFNRLSRELVPQ